MLKKIKNVYDSFFVLFFSGKEESTDPELYGPTVGTSMYTHSSVAHNLC